MENQIALNPNKIVQYLKKPSEVFTKEEMIFDANPQQAHESTQRMSNQTVELRSPDGSANVHLLFAGLTMAALYGLENIDSMEIADRLYTGKGACILDCYEQLPGSCWEAAEALEKNRALYQKHQVFPDYVIDNIIKTLKSVKDNMLSEKLFGNADELNKIVKENLHCG